MYKYIVWDFDGTLINSYPEVLRTYKEIFDNMHLHIDMNLVNDYLIRYSSTVLKNYLHDNYNLDVNEFNKQYDQISNSKESINNLLINNDSKEAVEKLNELGYKNFVVTNRDKACIDAFKNLNMYDLFVDIAYIGKDHITKRKPDPECFNYIINKYNLDPCEILYIGDRDLDIDMCDRVNVDCAIYRPIEGSKLKPKYVINNFVDILHICE
ncbi:MAG: HAD-IA family hydrolase [archaeon]|nr:HAD-IA family hydrolase [archaeon]